MNLERLMGPLDTEAMLQSLREVIAEPTSNLTLSVLLISVVSLVLLILVIIILLFVVGGEDDEEDEVGEDEAEGVRGALELEGEPVDSSAEAPPAAKRRTISIPPDSALGRALAAVGALIVPVIVLVALVVGYGISAQDTYCLTCHGGQLAERAPAASTPGASTAESSETGPHASTRCVACHEAGQVQGAVGNALDRARHLVAFVSGRREGRAALVPSKRCAECHASIESTVVADTERGVRMSHAEPLSAGVPCSECHRTVGHSPDAHEPGMSACLRCHDDESASAACPTCHTKETSFAARSRRVFAPTQTISRGDCGGCHSQKKCDDCHGMRMPHDIEFLSYEHARYAGFEKKEFCWRCHTQDDCGKCHQVKPLSVGYWGHGDGWWWKREHYNVPPGTVAGCGCHGRSPYVKARKDYCLACHEPGIR